MVNIEKLKLEHSIPTKTKSLTLTDFLLDNHMSGEYEFFSEVKELPSTTLKSDIAKTLEKNNIFIGNMFGTTGIGINELLNSDQYANLIIEVPNNHLQYYNISDIVSLSNRNKIVITDIEEGFCYQTIWTDTCGTKNVNNFHYFLKNSGINTNNVIALSPNLENNNLCKQIKIYGMWILLVILSSKFFIELVEDKHKREEYNKILRTKETEKFAVFKNWRPRPWRVALLSLLNKSKFLDKSIDWSLIGHTDPIRCTNYNIEFTQKSSEWIQKNPYRDEITTFFKEQPLPKFLDLDDTGNSWLYMPINDCKKYRYSIIVESSEQITEKMTKDILLGYIPIVVYPYENRQYIKQIKDMGFRVLDEDFDNHTSVQSIIRAVHTKIINLFQSPSIDTNEDVLENLKLCTDKTILCNYICQPLIDSFK